MSDAELFPCARGCTWDPIDDEPPRPKGARHGILCDSCFYRIRGALKLVPDLMANMRAQLFTMGTADYSERVSGGGGNSPAPLNIGPLDASDALFAKLLSWCTEFAEELHVAPPAVPSWANTREVQGSKPVSVEAAHMLASWLCDWLLDRAEEIAQSPSAVAYHDDLTAGHEDARGVFSLSAMYGVEARPVRPADKRECEVCGEREIFCKPPDLFDPEVSIMCGRCAHVVTPDAKKYAAYLAEIA
ncbi:hypothetical protein [Cryobacterium sp. GrIS_2_6]|uniref:hypothetical protein n=1 Tax=Cryobacterium sp. GrIS_2_6 TaxID=3162785 RepID=UPI002DF91531|nr:hypothetical protein [Cryobacterium psychrotolerans]MEC5149250.1 hypothetical protein [Cryobacterium psychrotolerans]MEC5149328.1 hypothetical protein [Cryobacterium psychrotolerans]